MADFLFIYRGGDEEEAEMSMEQMQEYMGKWHAWIGAAMSAGWMKAPGDALLPEGKVVGPNHTITDGPFTESKEMIGGYSVITAANLDEAVELTKGCPGFETGGKVEVRPLANVDIEAPEQPANS
jgi:hypothetical protein